ncbi:FAD-binding oxidoreductase [Actinocorallia sp. API 0066]|uniref:NAD(P)/FAD-dependent oxidoreductase n=1 Tax=Actinocorallia sp. API 0066 TaxID=2896846 RepID=UPI001E645E37|nr:FAD-binding oxidoreductase [Actinocorallia sp. API 0066]MCD0453693.1 FAD-binding oxidoreductase [Actinocorallia sp. API 0066]
MPFVNGPMVNGAVSHWFGETGLPAPAARLPGSLQADVCLVGAGYTGLWTAYYLKKARPDLRIVILEKEFAGFGASGRNGGWVVGELAGSPTAYADRFGRDAVVRLQREMFATVGEVVDVAAKEGIEADLAHDGLVTVARNRAQRWRMRQEVEHARGWGWGEDDLRLVEPGERVRVAGAVDAMYTPHCARVQPAKLVRGLARVVRDLGVELYEGTEVTALRPRSITSSAAALTPYGRVTAEYVIRATEGFTAAFRPLHRDWLPMNSSMIVTDPLPESVLDEIGWHGAELLGDMAHYYMYAQRTADGRIAFGGRGKPYRYGSRIDDAGRTPERTVRQLHTLLADFFPAAARVPVAHAWSGVLAVPRDWCSTAALDRRSGLGHAGGYTGHGVATTNLAGRTLRDLVLGEHTDLTDMPWVGWHVRPWEPEPLRWLGVQLMYALYKRADARERGLRKTSKVALLADLISGR